MRTFKARGLVLREYEAGESDKRLLLLCKGVGRLFVYARGARKPRSKFVAAAQVFSYGDYVIAEGRGFNSLAQASVIEGFYHLRSDYDALCCAHVVAEICEKAVMAEENCDELLLLALKALGYLHKKERPLPALHVLAVFMLRFFLWYGVAPSLEGEGGLINAEGLVGGEGAVGETVALSANGVTALRYIFSSDLARAFLFSVDASVVRELQNVANMLWRHHFEWALRSLTFIGE